MHANMSTPARALVHALLTATLVGLSACTSTPPPRLLSLPLPQAGSRPTMLAALPSAQDAADKGVLTVRRINLPEYLQSDKVRYRAADSVLGEWPGVVWAERLDASMTEQLVLRLRQALPGWTVCERACPAAQVSMSLMVDLLPLDYIRADSDMQATARWQLVPRQLRTRAGDAAGSAHAASAPDASGTAMRSGERALKLPVLPDSAEGQAAALARVLDAVAQDVAADVRRPHDAPDHH
jgi:uncharacterized lipoprotein YmbA